jgi:hypothetical protein
VPMTEPNIEDQLRMTLRAVARQVPEGPPRVPLAPPDLGAFAPGSSRPRPLLLSAAAVIAFLVLSVLAVRALPTPDQVQTGPGSSSPDAPPGTSSDPVPAPVDPPPPRSQDPQAFPRLAPTVTPDGFVLEQADSGTGPAVSPGWVSYWTAPVEGSTEPSRLTVRVDGDDPNPPRPSSWPLPGPDGVERVPTVDVNGTVANVNVGTPGVFTIAWPVGLGRHVAVSTSGSPGASFDEVLALARSVQVQDASLTAEVPKDAVPARFSPAYTGTDLSFLPDRASQWTNADLFRYHEEMGQRTAIVRVVNGLGFDPASYVTWIPTTFVATHLANGLTVLGPPRGAAADSGSITTIVGGNAGAVVKIQAPNTPVDVLYRVAEGLKPLDRASWQQVVGRADTPPHGAGGPSTPVCANLAAVAELVDPMGPHPEIVARLTDALAQLPDDVPPDVVAGLTQLRDTLVAQTSQAPTVDWAAYRQAFTLVDPWYRRTCGSSASALFQAAGSRRLLQPDPAIEPFCAAWSSFQASYDRQQGWAHVPHGIADTLEQVAAVAPEPLLAYTLRATGQRWRGLEGTELSVEEQNALIGVTNYAVSHCPNS